jgi:hypothetical protein
MNKSENNDIVVVFVLMYVVLFSMFFILNEIIAISFVVGIYFAFFYLYVLKRIYKIKLWKKQ